MTARDHFLSVMHYGAFDRMPVWHWTGWGETMERWYAEGLPREQHDQYTFFNAEPMMAGVPVNLGLFPTFETETIEEGDTYRLVRQEDGVIAKHSKLGSMIPQHVDSILKDRHMWPEYQKRLQPDPKRLPDNLDDILAELRDSGRPVAVSTGSMVGWLRNWMGVEHFCTACCEDPDFVAEVSDTIAELVCWFIKQVGAKIHIDMGWGWEDICFRNGPLVQPWVFKHAAVPGYRKISDTLRSFGCKLHLIDCDGYIDDLVPLWLDGGVNVMFPIEIGPWHADPLAFRRKYGKELRVIGGIDKLVLEYGRDAIDSEIERRKPLMAEGGFIPLPDHLITPGVPLTDYCYYLDQIRVLRF